MKTVKQIEKQIQELKVQMDNTKGRETSVFTRIVGYYRVTKHWNDGKSAEYNDRKTFKEGIYAKTEKD